MTIMASDFDKSKYLRAEDLKTEKKFRIKSVTVEEVGNDRKEEKLVVWFTNDKRGLVVNKTNNRTLRGAFGDDTSTWRDKIIIVFPTMVEYRGKITPGLRVRIPPPKGSNGQPAAKPATPPPTPAIDPPESGIDEDLDDEIVI